MINHPVLSPARPVRKQERPTRNWWLAFPGVKEL